MEARVSYCMEKESYWHTEAYAHLGEHSPTEHSSSADWDRSYWPHIQLEVTELLHHSRSIPSDRDHSQW